MARKSLLVGVPARPGRSKADRPLRDLLAAVPRDWSVDLVCAADGRYLERIAAAAAEPRAAVWILDDPRTRAAVRALAGGGCAPRVLIQFGDPDLALSAHERPEDHGSALLAARHPLGGPHELWRFSVSAPRLHLDGHLPTRYLQRERPDAAWVRSQLERLRLGREPKRARRGKASVIIPVWNNLKLTKACVDSVLRWSGAGLELIVVDNASADGTPRWLAALAKKDPRVRVLRNRENLGFAKAVNRGMRAARGKYLVWLNNDTLVSPRWLETMIECAERAPWVGAVGPVTNNANGLQQRIADGPYTRETFAFFADAWSLAHAGKTYPAHRLVGFCTLIKREAVERIGYLDERFGIGCYEDFDYSLRLRQAGYELAVAEEVVVHHDSHKTFEKLGGLDDRATRNREIFIDKWCRKSLDFLDSIDPILSTRR